MRHTLELVRSRKHVFPHLARWVLGMSLCQVGTAIPGSAAQVPIPADQARIVEFVGAVEYLREGSKTWEEAVVGRDLKPNDTVRTGERASLKIQWSDQSAVRIGEGSLFRIRPPQKPGQESGFRFWKGWLYLLHREKPSELEILTDAGVATVRSTEVNLEVQSNGRTILTVLEGLVEFENEQGHARLASGQQVVVEPGQRPITTAVLNAINVIQWALYYPAVLDLNELGWSEPEWEPIRDSVSCYLEGNLRQAVEAYPIARSPRTNSERIFLATLLLSLGQVPAAEGLLEEVQADDDPGPGMIALATALRGLIASVRGQPVAVARPPELATEWLVESYSLQAQGRLHEALDAARQAVERSPQFGFGWARVAELEFCFAHTPAALKAVGRSLALSPSNAQALCVRGFLLAARGRVYQAIASFDEAIGIDGGLGNAWLGRGLCRLRRGWLESGRQDLLMAAATEPQQAILRSYLGKAYANAGDRDRARHELDQAAQLDPGDPTAWLYSALLRHQWNEVNDAIRDLEQSVWLNENRRIQRSGLLLDQDRAVRSANLASLYRDAGMLDVSVREATQAVNDDYANYSAHLFLANSCDQLRDPKRINLRYETPAEVEYLVANLLAPVAAGTLSSTVSQQEYSQLFERDRLGLTSRTEYSSNGDWLQQAAQYGVLGDFGYAVELFHRSDVGQRPNHDFMEWRLSGLFKQQLSAQDTMMLQTQFYQAEGGDLNPYYDPSQANLGLRWQEEQIPLLTLGYHREWSPGMHTLVLAGRLADGIQVENPAMSTFFVVQSDDLIGLVRPLAMVEDYDSSLVIYSCELQQILQRERHTTIVGARVQGGEIETQTVLTYPFIDDVSGYLPDVLTQDLSSSFWRGTAYGYHHWRVWDPLLLVVGISYDWMSYPANFRAAPISDEAQTEDQVSPKAGLIWRPGQRTVVRAAYSRALSGASIDQSYQLEPTEVAGFNQAFRSIQPEAVGGANAGAHFEICGLAFEHRLPTETYMAISGEALRSEVDRSLGAFAHAPWPVLYAQPTQVHEHVDYAENTLRLTIDQLIAGGWALGVRYRLSRVDLRFCDWNVAPDALSLLGYRREQELESVLHQLDLRAAWNHRWGFFAQFQAQWNHQENGGYDPARCGDDFWQFHVHLGYRLPLRRAEVRIGLLNLTDQDYRLEPLVLYDEPLRERTFVARLQFRF